MGLPWYHVYPVVLNDSVHLLYVHIMYIALVYKISMTIKEKEKKKT